MRWGYRLEEVMRIGALKMTRAQVAAGCLVVLMSLAGGVASAHWLNHKTSQDTMSLAMWWETSVTALEQASQGVTREAAAMAESATPRHACITLDGKSFEWDFANAPFAVLSCSQ
jgi:hypothetical protein